MSTSTGGSTGSFDLSDININIDGYNLEGDELHTSQITWNGT